MVLRFDLSRPAQVALIHEGLDGELTRLMSADCESEDGMLSAGEHWFSAGVGQVMMRECGNAGMRELVGGAKVGRHLFVSQY